MRFSLERVSGPSVEPVTVAEMRGNPLREFDDVTSNTTDISGLITTAREWVEEYSGRALVEQSWRLTIDGYRMGYFGLDVMAGYRGPYFGSTWMAEWSYWWRRGEIWLHKSPVIAITGFASVDSAGVETEIDVANYELRNKDSKWPKLVPLNGASWPSGILRITYRAGFAAGIGSPDPAPDLTLVPARYKQAIKLHCEAMYDRDVKSMQLYLDAAENLIKPERSELSLA